MANFNFLQLLEVVFTKDVFGCPEVVKVRKKDRI